MKSISLIIACAFVICVIVSCTPYNSNRVNEQLIQGKWQLMDVEHDVYDIISVDYTKEQTYLEFEGDSCIQYMPDLKDTLMLFFSIRDYQLAFFHDSLMVSRFSIDSLNEKKLVLSHNSNQRVYMKIK